MSKKLAKKEKNQTLEKEATMVENIVSNDNASITTELIDKIEEKPDEIVNETQEKEEEHQLKETSQNTSTDESIHIMIEANETSSETEPLPKKEKSKKSIFIFGFILLFFVLLLFLLSTIFALFYQQKNTIIPGVSIKGISVSGLTKQEAIDKVSKEFSQKLSEPITLYHGNYETTVFPEQFNVSFDIEAAAQLAYEKGRNSNIFQDNFEILSSLFSDTDINPGFLYTEETMDSLINEMQANLEDRFIEPSYYIDGNQLIISKGKNGVEISSSGLKTEFTYFLTNLTVTGSSIDIPVTEKIVDSIKLEKIHKEVYRAPQDAYYTTNPYVVYPHAEGIDFGISMEEANALLNSSEDSFTIPLKVLSPSITTSQIGREAFPDLLATYSTTFSTRNGNRTTNIKLATQKINGTVIMPGETFSYNQVVGKRTTAAGFKSATVYMAGEVTTGIGGGICQVSSTLYNSVLLSNLEIVERHNHGFNTGYVPVGRDATVSWGGPDFKFKNSRNYPIKIVATVSGGTNTIQIFGLKSENEYEVELQSYVTSWISYKTINKNDATLPKGTTKVIQNGSSGCRSVAYRILKQNGQVISKTLLSKDTYNPHNKIVAVGTKQ